MKNKNKKLIIVKPTHSFLRLESKIILKFTVIKLFKLLNVNNVNIYQLRMGTNYKL